MTIEQVGESESPARSAVSTDLRRLGALVKAVAFVAVGFCFTGCGDHDELPEITKQAVKFEEVPENVRTRRVRPFQG